MTHEEWREASDALARFFIDMRRMWLEAHPQEDMETWDWPELFRSYARCRVWLTEEYQRDQQRTEAG